MSNSWLNIHPNCLHQLIRWTPMGRSEEELKKIKDFSSFEKNPPTRDPRTKKQIEAYRKKEQGRAKWLASYRQFERYRETIPGDTPKTFQTFLKHKLADDEKYKEWKRLYRKTNTLANQRKGDILNDNKKYIGIPITDEAIQRVPLVCPDGWSRERAERLQEAHRELLRAVKDKPVGTEAGRAYRLDMSPMSPLIVGKDADHRVFLPPCFEPHAFIHNHPSGLTFSDGDIEKFGWNFALETLTVVGNNGEVYILEKTNQYDPVGFSKAFSLEHSLLDQTKTPEDYAEEMNRFLKEAEQYGVKFITRG